MLNVRLSHKRVKNIFDEVIFAALEPPEPVRRRWWRTGMDWYRESLGTKLALILVSTYLRVFSFFLCIISFQFCM